MVIFTLQKSDITKYPMLFPCNQGYHLVPELGKKKKLASSEFEPATFQWKRLHFLINLYKVTLPIS